MVAQICVNIGSGNGLLPDSTKPLPEPMLTYNHVRSIDIHLRDTRVTLYTAGQLAHSPAT